MSSIRTCLAAGVALLALSADAGLVYRYSSKSSAALASDTRGRVWIDGDRKRVDLESGPSGPRSHDRAITADGTTTYVNLQNRTYYRLDGAVRRSSGLFDLPPPGGQVDGRPKITHQLVQGEPFGGRATTTLTLQIRYRVRGDFQGEPLRGNVDATVTLRAVPALPRVDAEDLVRTGFAEVDEELAKVYASFGGLIVSREMSVNRRLEGGMIVNEFSKFTVEELQEVPVEDSVFVMPTGLTQQKPVVAAPGQ